MPRQYCDYWMQSRTSEWWGTLFSTFVFTKIMVTIVSWKKSMFMCLWPTLPDLTHFTRLHSTIITETQIWNWIEFSQLKTEILEIWYEKCSAKTRLIFETTILSNTIITIQSWFIVGINYQLPQVSGHYIK